MNHAFPIDAVLWGGRWAGDWRSNPSAHSVGKVIVMLCTWGGIPLPVHLRHQRGLGRVMTKYPSSLRRYLTCYLTFLQWPEPGGSSSYWMCNGLIVSIMFSPLKTKCPVPNHFLISVQKNDLLVSLCVCSPLITRLRKDLKGLFVVHPAWYVKALITVVKPFIR